jgi:PAS domain S-box-containing protein
MAVQSPNRPPRRPPDPKRERTPIGAATTPHERHALLQTMLDHVAQAIAMFDAEHRLVAWNDQLRTLLDLSDNLVAGAPSYADFIAYLAARGDFGEGSKSVDAAVRELTAALHEPRTDERMLPDGRILECRRSPLPQGGLILIYTDVSEQRHADYLVQDSERRLQTILEKAPVALAVIGQEDGEIKQVNARFRKLFGLAGKKLPDEPDIALHVSPDERELILGAQSSSHTDFEAAVRRTDGTQFWALVSSIRFVFEWAPAILTSFHDISDRRHAEAGLRDELARKQAELGEARVLQLELAPPDLRSSIGDCEFQVDVVLEPAKEVGGDLVDYFRIDDNLLVVVLGDVSHKGAGAALFMARTHSLVRSIAARPDAATLFGAPAEAVALINAALSRNNAMCMFVTLLLATFDAATGRLAYVRAGHLPPLLRRASGAMERLGVLGGPPLGLVEGVVHKSASVNLGPGDQVLIVTDGITEAADPSGEMFGEARLEAFFAAVRPGETDPLRRLTAAVRTFEAGAPPADDVAAVRLAIYDVPGGVRLEPL